MKLEEKIKILEDELALKNAYLSVNITFGHKGKAIPKEVKAAVSKTLKEICTKLAENQDALELSDGGLTTNDIKILKQLANTVLERSNPKPTPKPKKARAVFKEEVTNVPTKGQRAQLMLTDNVPSGQRKKVPSLSIVHIIEQKGENVFVETDRGVRFFIPMEDLDFNLE